MLFLEYFPGMVKHREKPDTSAVHTWSALYYLHMEASRTWHVKPSCVCAVTLACPQHAGVAAQTQLSVSSGHPSYIRLGIHAVDGICHHSPV